MYRKKLPSPIHWHEGMFLQPHHFQHHSRLEEETLTYRARLLSPYQWGVYRLEVDDDAIAAGRFSVQEVEAILPDGLVLQTGHLARPLARDLSPFEERLRNDETLAVHLAIPKLAPKTIQTENGEDPGYPLRYRSQPPVTALDETNGAPNEAQIVTLKIDARLLVGDEDRSGFETIPIAEVAYSGDVLRTTDFIPPAVLVLRSSPIADRVRRITQLLRDTATAVAGGFDSAARHQDAGRTLEARFQAYGLVASLLPLAQMAELECFRPLDIYLALCRVIGELSTLGLSIVPEAAPPYDHLDLRGTFDRLEQRIRDLVKLPQTEFEELEVRGEDGKFEVLNLRLDQLGRPMYFAIRGGPSSDEKKLHRWVVDNCVIANRSQVRDLIKLAILGIPREVQEAPPLRLLLGRGYLVYRLVPSGDYFQALKEDTSLLFIRSRPESPADDMERPRILKVFVQKAG